MVFIDADVVGYEAIVESFLLIQIFPSLTNSVLRDSLKATLLNGLRRLFSHMKKKKITQTIA